VRLWPGDAPATQPFDPEDQVRDRGRPDAPNMWITRVISPSLAVYLPTAAAPTAAAIICPGGGYAGESATNEGTNIAHALAEQGVAAFILKYRLPDGRAPAEGELPVPQQDVMRAIQLVRAEAARFNVDPKHVGVFGFSAGGHLAATAATLYDQANTFAGRVNGDAISRVSARPDFAVLVYPVITMDKAASHGGSRKNLIGQDADAALEVRFSADAHVTPQTPPLFIVHAADDKAVPLANAQRMTAAAAKAGVPHELVIYDKGGHGFGLGNNEQTRTWMPKCLAWLRANGAIAH
jgi:acetyl esterase/lipase